MTTLYQSSTKSSLQVTLQAGSAMSSLPQVLPHHPLTCPSRLRFEEDGTFSCEHATVGPGDRRTQFALDQSVAMLLIEEAFRL